MLVWRDYNEARTFGLDNSTVASSGIQLGGWTDTTVSRRRSAILRKIPRNWRAGLPAVDGANPDVDVQPLSPPTTTRLDGRSFAVFHRAVRYDVFDGPEALFTVPATSPCSGGANPRWIGAVESVQMTFGGFTDTDQLTLSVGTVNGAQTLVPTGWQIYDDGGANVYSPEMRVGVFAVLPAFADTVSTLSPTDRGNCSALAIHGEVDSADTNVNVGVFAAMDVNTVTPQIEITRSCVQSDGMTPYTLDQVLPPIPRTHLADVNGTPTSPPSVRLSVMAHCAAPGSDV